MDKKTFYELSSIEKRKYISLIQSNETQSIFRMKYLEQRTYNQIADKLGYSREGIRTRIYRTLSKI